MGQNSKAFIFKLIPVVFLLLITACGSRNFGADNGSAVDIISDSYVLNGGGELSEYGTPLELQDYIDYIIEDILQYPFPQGTMVSAVGYYYISAEDHILDYSQYLYLPIVYENKIINWYRLQKDYPQAHLSNGFDETLLSQDPVSYFKDFPESSICSIIKARPECCFTVVYNPGGVYLISDDNMVYWIQGGETDPAIENADLLFASLSNPDYVLSIEMFDVKSALYIVP